MAWVNVEGWSGTAGRVWEDDTGKRTFYIRRRVNGRRYDVSTRATTLRGAMKQLERFEADPAGYAPSEVGDQRLFFTDNLRTAFEDWSEHERHTSPEWLRRQKTYLRWWQERLAKFDLRRVTARDHLIPALIGCTARPHRIACIKVFYSAYLRRERHLITTAEDPTLDMRVPQAKPAQWNKSKVIDVADEAKVVLALKDRWADIALLLKATGAHVTEIVRFAKDGSVEKRHDGGYTLVLPSVKVGGGPHRIDVTADTAELAQGVLKAGPFSESRFRKAVRDAKKRSGAKFYQPGSLRHTFATKLVEAGASVESVSAYLHHLSPQTTKRFYTVMGTVPRPKLPEVG